MHARISIIIAGKGEPLTFILQSTLTDIDNVIVIAMEETIFEVTSCYNFILWSLTFFQKLSILSIWYLYYVQIVNLTK